MYVLTLPVQCSRNGHVFPRFALGSSRGRDGGPRGCGVGWLESDGLGTLEHHYEISVSYLSWDVRSVLLSLFKLSPCAKYNPIWTRRLEFRLMDAMNTLPIHILYTKT